MLEAIHVIYIALRIGIAEWFNDRRRVEGEMNNAAREY